MKHALSPRWLADSNRACSTFLIIFGACLNILFIIEVNILLLNDHIDPSIMLTIEPRMVGNFWALSLVSFKHDFLVSILRSTPHCAPLKYMCSFRMSNWIRPAYLSHYLGLNVSGWNDSQLMHCKGIFLMRMMKICSQYLRPEIVLSIWIDFPV